VGLDRSLVIQLQRALAARVDGHAASPGAWLEIRRRALEPERTGWLGRLLPGLRLAPIGASLIVVLALLATPNVSPFRVDRDLAAASSEPTWRILEEVEALDEEDAEATRWWLRYVTVEAPETGVVATSDRWERMTAAAPLGGYARQ
jgi:hypothetical protein